MAASASCPAASPDRGQPARLRLGLAVLFFAVLLLAPATRAFAGQAAAGELFFYPCNDCHPVSVSPVTKQPSHPLPNGFKGHGIVLEGHDKLGSGDEACLACHQDAETDPGKLKIAGGKTIDIKGDVAQVCYRCHSAKYKEWKAGVHGKSEPKCTAAGCHDPHTPGYIYAGQLMPFVGTGFQFKVLPERAAFSPLAPPAPAPPVDTPPWYVAAFVLGAAAVVGLISRLVPERQKR